MKRRFRKWPMKHQHFKMAVVPEWYTYPTLDMCTVWYSLISITEVSGHFFLTIHHQHSLNIERHCSDAPWYSWIWLRYSPIQLKWSSFHLKEKTTERQVMAIWPIWSIHNAFPLFFSCPLEAIMCTLHT